MSARRAPIPPKVDVVVVGAGFGGMATALRLSELGANVVLCEALSYPGGCASTFERDGYRFESGATLFSGLGRGQLFRRWIDRYGLDVTVDWLDPVVELRGPDTRLTVPACRQAFINELADAPGAPRRKIRDFFEIQRAVADVLWEMLDDPDRLPPLGVSQALAHARRAHRYLPLASLVGKTLVSVLDEHDVAHYQPLRLYADALCQITVQCPASDAEALFALGTMDYFFRGTGHVRNGIGQLAWGLVRAIEAAGGTVSMATRVRRLEQTPSGYRVVTNQGEIEASRVVANVLPQSLWELTGKRAGTLPVADRLSRDVERGWGAAMLYRVATPPSAEPSSPHHLQLVDDPNRRLIEGNHVFCSVSGSGDTERAPDDHRTLTVSTHVPVAKLAEMDLPAQAEYIDSVQGRMRETLKLRAPEWEPGVVHELTASPRTFQRFTQRYLGYVGGIPRRAGWHNYRGFTPRPVLPGLYLVGDTVFPGQSTLATALGGYKLAEHLAA